MRPLNTNEGNYRRVWKVLPKYNSVTQTTSEGKPLAERVTGRTFFTFDKTFGEDADTKTVYESCAKGIVDSVVSGLNGTIFAYGQTSSGKTFTMQGSGTIAQGSASHSGGIVHMAANDIFRHIQSNPDRMFLVRASFLEIYNEEVRDLLSPDQKVLQIREDPRRGVFVKSHEEFVTDYESLLQVLFTGEKSRAFAATAMNERSSRSHTIFRITIESRVKTDEKENEESDDEDNSITSRPDGAVRVATLNLVDLAGSESVRHTGATGDRQKEGGMINQSLLTLSRVIVALGQANQAHVNFRDSKLTRLLQPSLSGNARMAIICCATPSELYLEETRSTLGFANRAKNVKTNAKVNEILDDRSLIRRLQKELAEARAEAGGAPSAKVKALEEEAATAGTAARKANEKLRKLQAAILNNGGVFSRPKVQYVEADCDQRKRRRSDGGFRLASQNSLAALPPSPKTLPRPEKKKRLLEVRPLSSVKQLALMREALVSKSNQVVDYQRQINDIVNKVEEKESELSDLEMKNNSLQSERCEASETIDKLRTELMELKEELERANRAHGILLAEKEKDTQELLKKLEQELEDRKQLEETVDTLQEEKNEARSAWQELKNENQNMSTKIEELSAQLNEKSMELNQSAEENQKLVQDQLENKERLGLLSSELETVSKSFQDTQDKLRDSENAKIELVTSLNDARTECETRSDRITSLQQLLESERHDRRETETRLREQIQQSQLAWEELSAEKMQTEKDFAACKESLCSEKDRNHDLEEKCSGLQHNVRGLNTENRELKEEIVVLKRRTEQAEHEIANINSFCSTLHALAILRMQRVQSEHSERESTLIENLHRAQDLLDTACSDLKASNNRAEEFSTKVVELEEEVSKLKRSEAELFSLLNDAKGLHSKAENDIAVLKDGIDTLEHEKKQLSEKLQLSNKCAVEEARKVKELQNEIDQLETKVFECQANIQTSLEEKNSLQQQLDEEKNKSLSLSTKIDAQAKQAQLLELSIEKLEQAEKELLSQIAESNKIQGDVALDNKNLKNELAKIKLEKSHLFAELERIEEERKEGVYQSMYLQAISLVRLARNTTSSSAKEQELSAQVQTVSLELDSTSAELKNILHEFEKKSEQANSLQSKLLEVEESKQKVSDELSECKEDLKLAQNMVEELSTRIQNKDLEAETVKSDLSDSLNLLKEQNQSLLSEKRTVESENVSLKSELDSMKVDYQTLTSELDLKAVAMQELTKNFNEITGALEMFEKDAVELRSEVENLHVRLEQAQEELDSTRKERNELISQLEIQEALVKELGLMRDTINNQLEALRSELSSARERVEKSEAIQTKLQEEAVFSNQNCEQMRSTLEDMQFTVASLENQLDQRAAERDQFEVAYALLFVRLLATDSSLRAEEEKSANLLTETNRKNDEIDKFHHLMLETSKILDNAVARATRSISNNGKDEDMSSDNKTENLERDGQKAANCLASMHSCAIALQSLFEQRETEFNEMRRAFKTTTDRLNFLENAREIALARLLKLEENGNVGRVELQSALAEIQLKRDECGSLKSLVEDSESKISFLENERSYLQSQLQDLCTQNQKLEEGISVLESNLASEREALNGKEKELLARLQDVLSQNENLSLGQSEIESLLADANGKVNALEKQLEAEIANSKTLSRAIEKHNIEMSDIHAERNALEQTLAMKESRIEMLESEVSGLQIERQDLQERCQSNERSSSELEQKLLQRDDDLLKMKSRSADMERELTSAVNALIQEKAELQDRICQLEEEVQKVESEILQVQSESSTRANELIQLHDWIESSNATNAQLKKQLFDLEESLSSKDTMLSQAYDALEQEKTRANDQTELLSKEVATLRDSLLQLEQDSGRMGEIESAEVDELKNMLASANQTIEDLNGYQKGLLEKISFAESRQKELEEKIQSLEREKLLLHQKSELSSTELNEHEARLEIENLRALIESEKELRRTLEEDLNTRFEEERRSLIQDAEETMESLRAEIQSLQSSLEKSEAEAYASRQSAEELRDEIKQYVEDSIQIKSRVASLENENSRLKRSAIRVENEKDTESAALKAELSRVRSDAAAARDTQHALESRLAVYEDRLAQKEKEFKQVLQNMKDLNVPGLEREIEELRSSLQKATDRLAVNENAASEVSHLTEQIQQLQDQIALKDERINKLEKIKLTKEKLIAMKKMKREYKELKEEKEILRSRLRVAEETIASYTSSGGTEHSAEVTQLKFDKDALESKLRKYATHCQRLEEERDSIRKVLHSNKVLGADTESVADAVVTLVDRLTSIEEECDSLSRTESQASSYLVEIERLRQHNASLKSEISEMAKNLEKYSRLEMKLNESIRALKHQLDISQKEAKEAQDSACEVKRKHSRTIQRLEQENLQLHEAFKAKKNEAMKYKGELNAIKLLSPSIPQANTVVPFVTQKNSDSQKSTTPNSRPTKTQGPSQVVQSKENSENGLNELGARPPRGSAHKSSRRRAPGLGEALEANDENTQDCKQS